MAQPTHRRAPIGARLLVSATMALFIALSTPWTADAQPAVGRIRKELRRLTKTEIQLFVRGINTLMTTPTAVGQLTYGPLYKDYRYFIVKHAVASNDPRGDQGHGAPCFLTFHRSWLLELEAALLSVVPDLKALPYWDITRDLRGGDISRTSRNYIFSSSWFGSLDGNAREGYAVTNGLFPRQAVLTYEVPPGHENTFSIFNGSSAGLMRSYGNQDPRPFVTRLPVQQVVNSFRGTALSSLLWVSGRRNNELPMNYNAFDYWFCTDASAVLTWVDYSTCADLQTLENSGASDDDIVNVMRSTRSPMLHPVPHWCVGGGFDDDTGDFQAVDTSPNEAALFIVHHANIDRQNMIWQRNVVAVDPSAVTRSFDYPVSADDYPNAWPGCYLNDVITSAFPFIDIFPGRGPPDPAGYTHADVIQLTAPGVVTYSYDQMTRPASAGRKLKEHLQAGFKWPRFYKQARRQE